MIGDESNKMVKNALDVKKKIISLQSLIGKVKKTF